ncbi:MAG: hypothetical protein ACRC20_17165 [Segniliparus sp.]|uniref:hypothetical protein n=1 Tax=Segniliparus sp. TaxID=2804064 RepID=UPI003F317E93
MPPAGGQTVDRSNGKYVKDPGDRVSRPNETNQLPRYHVVYPDGSQQLGWDDGSYARVEPPTDDGRPQGGFLVARGANPLNPDKPEGRGGGVDRRGDVSGQVRSYDNNTGNSNFDKGLQVPGLQPGDDRSHVLADSLGLGGFPGNVIAAPQRVNRSFMSPLEREARDTGLNGQPFIYAVRLVNPPLPLVDPDDPNSGTVGLDDPRARPTQIVQGFARKGQRLISISNNPVDPDNIDPDAPEITPETNDEFDPFFDAPDWDSVADQTTGDEQSSEQSANVPVGSTH